MFAVADVFNRNYKRLQKDFASFVLSLVGYYPMQSNTRLSNNIIAGEYN